MKNGPFGDFVLSGGGVAGMVLMDTFISYGSRSLGSSVLAMRISFADGCWIARITLA